METSLRNFYAQDIYQKHFSASFDIENNYGFIILFVGVESHERWTVLGRIPSWRPLPLRLDFAKSTPFRWRWPFRTSRPLKRAPLQELSLMTKRVRSGSGLWSYTSRPFRMSSCLLLVLQIIVSIYSKSVWESTWFESFLATNNNARAQSLNWRRNMAKMRKLRIYFISDLGHVPLSWYFWRNFSFESNILSVCAFLRRLGRDSRYLSVERGGITGSASAEFSETSSDSSSASFWSALNEPRRAFSPINQPQEHKFIQWNSWSAAERWQKEKKEQWNNKWCKFDFKWTLRHLTSDEKKRRLVTIE